MHRLKLSQNASEPAEAPLSARQTSAWLICYLEQLSRPGAALVIQTWWRSHQARVFFLRWEQQYAGLCLRPSAIRTQACMAVFSLMQVPENAQAGFA